MKVLYIHQYFTTPQGSSGTRSYEFAKKLIEFNHSVTMICSSSEVGVTGLTSEFLNGKREGYVEGIYVIEFDLKYSNYDNLFKRAIKFIKYSVKSVNISLFRKYDIIFATSTPLTAAIPGIFAKIFRRKPFVFEVRDLWPELPKAMGVVKNPIIILFMSILEWLAYNLSNACVGLSPGMVIGIKRRLLNKNKEITLISNGCDIDFFQCINKSDFQIDGIKKDDFIAVFTGAHGNANGLDSVLDACSILMKKNITDIKIVFVGDGKMKPYLINRKEKEGLNNCIFIDPIPKTLIPSLLKKADLGLMVLKNIPEFYRGTSPNKFFDYISAGLPVLNNYPGWVSEMILSSNCGYVSEVEQPTNFAENLIKAKNDKKKGLLAIKGKNALELAKSEFDRNILSDKFVKMIEKYGIDAQKSR